MSKKPIPVPMPTPPESDVVITSAGGGVVTVQTANITITGTQIGELRRELYLLIDALGQFSRIHNLPANLNKKGVPFKRNRRKAIII